MGTLEFTLFILYCYRSIKLPLTTHEVILPTVVFYGAVLITVLKYSCLYIHMLKRQSENISRKIRSLQCH